MEETVEWLVEGLCAGGGDFRFFGSGNWFIRGFVIPLGRVVGAVVGVLGRSSAMSAFCSSFGVSLAGIDGGCGDGDRCFDGGVGRNPKSKGDTGASSSVNVGPGPLDRCGVDVENAKFSGFRN